MLIEKSEDRRTVRLKAEMGTAGAEMLVVVVKHGNSRGAKGHPCFLCKGSQINCTSRKNRGGLEHIQATACRAGCAERRTSGSVGDLGRNSPSLPEDTSLCKESPRLRCTHLQRKPIRLELIEVCCYRDCHLLLCLFYRVYPYRYPISRPHAVDTAKWQVGIYLAALDPVAYKSRVGYIRKTAHTASVPATNHLTVLSTAS